MLEPRFARLRRRGAAPSNTTRMVLLELAGKAGGRRYGARIVYEYVYRSAEYVYGFMRVLRYRVGELERDCYWLRRANRT